MLQQLETLYLGLSSEFSTVYGQTAFNPTNKLGSQDFDNCLGGPLVKIKRKEVKEYFTGLKKKHNTMFQQKQSRCIISIDTKTFKDPLGNMDII